MKNSIDECAKACDIGCDMKNITLPKNGSLIRFTRLPAGSYAGIGEIYRVEVNSVDVCLRSLKTGAGTMDRLATYRWSEFETTAENQ